MTTPGRRAGVGAVILIALAAVVLALSSPFGDDGSDGDSVPQTSGPIVVALDGRPAAVASGAGALWVADDERGVVLRLDPTDGSPIGPPIAVSPAPRAMAVGTTTVWVADADGTVTRIDADTGEADAPIALGGALVDVAVDGEQAWIGDIEAGTVRSVDAATGVVGAAITVPGGVVRLAVADRQLWVTGLEATVTPIDLETGMVGSPVPVGRVPSAWR